MILCMVPIHHLDIEKGKPFCISSHIMHSLGKSLNMHTDDPARRGVMIDTKKSMNECSSNSSATEMIVHGSTVR